MSPPPANGKGTCRPAKGKKRIGDNYWPIAQYVSKLILCTIGNKFQTQVTDSVSCKSLTIY